MSLAHLSFDAFTSWLRGFADGPDAAGGGGAVAVVDLDGAPATSLPDLHTGIAAVVVGTTTRDPQAHRAASACDVVVRRDDPALDVIAETVARHPLAATSLAVLLRGSEGRSIDDGLVAESAVYSSLQAGPEFTAWRDGRARRDSRPQGDPVRIERSGPVLQVVLTRPEVRNALDTAMRDQLVEAFRLPAADPTITEVHLRGAGEAFSSGGDLDEFGSFPDPATAHLVRLQQSAGRAIALVADRVTAHLHGACIGSGVELPAFARRVVADPSTAISLPEVFLGLIPGAGGTVSLPRRIGRHRTARLALTGEVIDAPTALAWGLVDAIGEGGRPATDH